YDLVTGVQTCALPISNQQSIAKAPDNLAGYQNLSALHLQAGKTNEALAVIERAASRANGTNASPEFLLGVADLLIRYNRQQLLRSEERRVGNECVCGW